MSHDEIKPGDKVLVDLSGNPDKPNNQVCTVKYVAGQNIGVKLIKWLPGVSWYPVEQCKKVIE